MSDRTEAQTDWGYAYEGWYGNSFAFSYNGQTVLPPIAAVRGSGTYQGTNAYERPCLAGSVNGLGLDGYPLAPAGTYLTYGLMLRHPTIALAYAAATLPILAAGWKYEADDDAPDGAKELIEKTFAPKRTEILVQQLRALPLGYQSFEIVWKDQDGYTVPDWFKPLLPRWTRPLTEKGGRLIGLEQGSVKLTQPGSWMWHAHDVHGTDWFGRGRLENIRRHWANALASEDQSFRMEQKAAGIQVTVGHPPDTMTPEQLTAKNLVSNHAKGKEIGSALKRGETVVFENVSAFILEDIEKAAAMAGKSFWSVNPLDLGDTGPAQSAINNKLPYLDKLMVRGMLRPERSVLEADTAGSRADAEAHTASVADTDADTQHELACNTLNRQVVDELLAQNFGEQYRGKVRIAPVQIVDEVRGVVNAFRDAILGDPLLRAEALEQIDRGKLYEAFGLPMKKNRPPLEGTPPTEGTETADGKTDDEHADDDAPQD